MLSFIVPAHNEESLLGRTLESIRAAAGACGELFEIIVVDDASTDATAEVASAGGARVVQVNVRHIAAARNAGAKHAAGDKLIFVDADTILPKATLEAALRALRQGAVGGGAWVRFDERPPFGYRLALALFMWALFKVIRTAAGCFIFARRHAFEAVGGFDERYFASEEIHLTMALRRQGKFVILGETVITSGRKLRLDPAWKMMLRTLRILARGPRGLQRREGLDLWYDWRSPGQARSSTPRDNTPT